MTRTINLQQDQQSTRILMAGSFSLLHENWMLKKRGRT